MKKIFFAAMVAAIAMAVASCGKKAPKANLESDIDTLSYAIGMSQTQGLKDYLINRLGVDTMYADEFVKGFLEGANAGEDKKQAAYFAGIQIGQQISNQVVKGVNYQLYGQFGDSVSTVSIKNLLAGFIAGYKEDYATMTTEQASIYAQAKWSAVQQKQEEARMAEMAKKAEKEYASNKAAGEKFLAENAKKEGVVTLKSGVQYKVLEAAEGAKPKADATVKCFYELRLIDGKVVESNFDKETPAQFPLSGVISGWQEALQQMPVGSTWEVYIPQDKAYGPQDKGDIKPFSALIFKIKLVAAE